MRTVHHCPRVKWPSRGRGHICILQTVWLFKIRIHWKYTLVLSLTHFIKGSWAQMKFCSENLCISYNSIVPWGQVKNLHMTRHMQNCIQTWSIIFLREQQNCWRLLIYEHTNPLWNCWLITISNIYLSLLVHNVANSDSVAYSPEP